jgi:NADH-quinone oxidoreductase subunit M
LYGDVLQALQTAHPLTPREEALLFLAFALAFAVKVPMVPLHMWLPAAHVEAPTPGSVLLAGVLLKMGTYGLLRFCVPLFPQAVTRFQGVMVALGVVGVIYGAWAALAQTDMKRLVAYSSISHLGLIVVGIFALQPTAAQGAILQMVNHGISTGGLFVLVGLLYERRHTREMDAYGGLASVLPRYAAVFLVVLLSSIGLPFLNGFVGEFLIFWGAFRRYPVATALAVTGVIWSAVYMLRMYQRVMHGPVTREENRRLADMRPSEWAAMVPLLVLAVWIGLWATPFLERTQTAVQSILRP